MTKLEPVEIEYDGFVGDVIGHYVTREGKRGVVVQQHGTRVVHVYGEARVKPASPPSPSGGEPEPVAWVTPDILAAMKRGERVVPGWKYSADFCIPLFASPPKPSEAK